MLRKIKMTAVFALVLLMASVATMTLQVKSQDNIPHGGFTEGLPGGSIPPQLALLLALHTTLCLTSAAGQTLLVQVKVCLLTFVLSRPSM
jgi:hypothetical protein